MIPWYAISCKETPERGDACRRHFEERGFAVAGSEAARPADRPSVLFWRGVHGDSWGLDTRLVFDPRRPGAYDAHKITPGHVGLILSFWSLWQHVHACGHEAAVVCEDDVILPREINFAAEEVKRVADAAVPGWGMIWLGHVCEPTRGPRIAEANVSRSAERSDGNPWQRVGLHRGHAYGLHCMLLRRSALPVLLDTNTKVWAHLDIQIPRFSAPRLETLVVCPSLAAQRTYAGEWQPSTVDPAKVRERDLWRR